MKVPHIVNLYKFRTVSQFKNDMDVFLRFYRPLSFQDFLLCLEQSQTPARNTFMLTFDDGLRECYEVVAPILKEKGIPATFFLCSAFVDNKEMAYDFKKALLASALKNRRMTPAQDGQVRAVLEGVGLNTPDLGAAVLLVDYLRRPVLDQIAALLECDFKSYLETVQPYLTSEQVIELLKMGHAVGAHSVDHPRYSDLPLAEQIYQTRASVEFVKKRFAPGYGAFSFPHSDANVTNEFFKEVFSTGEVDVCFGNQGFLQDSVPRNVQRSSMEKTSMSAEGILGKSLARRFIKRMRGQLVVRRA
jgi:peptidoglycan/xylan/chitin deacetylase (PgdA/CDA1 family)